LNFISVLPIVVPRTGIEPVRPLCRKAADFKSAVSTNFTIEAVQLVHCPAKSVTNRQKADFSTLTEGFEHQKSARSADNLHMQPRHTNSPEFAILIAS
jgi:hypothetical protein